MRFINSLYTDLYNSMEKQRTSFRAEGKKLAFWNFSMNLKLNEYVEYCLISLRTEQGLRLFSTFKLFLFFQKIKQR